MSKLGRFLRRVFSRRKPAVVSADEAARLKGLFQERYQDFRQLLAANNKTLDLMAEMELALADRRPVGMAFVNGRVTTLGVNVFQMIKRLDRLAPAKYETLFDRFRHIQHDINLCLTAGPPATAGPLTVRFDEVDKDATDLVGAKMANLGYLRNRLKIVTPPGFVITAAAYRRFMDHNRLQEEINRLIQVATVDRTDKLFALSSSIRQDIVAAETPDDLTEAIYN